MTALIHPSRATIMHRVDLVPLACQTTLTLAIAGGIEQSDGLVSSAFAISQFVCCNLTTISVNDRSPPIGLRRVQWREKISN